MSEIKQYQRPAEPWVDQGGGTNGADDDPTNPTLQVWRLPHRHGRARSPPAIVKRKHEAAWQLVQTLGTKDPSEARARAPAVLERLRAWIRAADAEHRGAKVRLTDRQIGALCGQWLTTQTERFRDDLGGDAEGYDHWTGERGDALQALDRQDDPDGVAQALALATVQADIDTLLAGAGLTVEDDTEHRLARRLLYVQWMWGRDMGHRASTGTWRESLKQSDFPVALPTAPPARPEVIPAGCLLLDILAGFAGDRGWKLDVRPVPRALYDRQRTAARFIAFLGHGDASLVGKADVVMWKAEMQSRGLKPATVRNDLSEMSALWGWGIANGKLSGLNPFAGVLLRKPTQGARAVRAFTSTEAATIVTAARAETGFLRWLPLVLCLTGARLNEVMQSTREDVTTMDDHPVLLIHADTPGRSIKNADSRRSVPLHPALVAEGFLSYVAGLPVGSPLFPDVAPDALFGRRATEAARIVARWLRGTVGITDPRISPSHSWRHTFVDLCRQVVMSAEVRSAITGHSGRADESASYGAGMGSLVAVMAAQMARVVPPWPPTGSLG